MVVTPNLGSTNKSPLAYRLKSTSVFHSLPYLSRTLSDKVAQPNPTVLQEQESTLFTN